MVVVRIIVKIVLLPVRICLTMIQGKGINRKKLVPFVLPIFIFSQNPMQRIFEKQTERRSC